MSAPTFPCPCCGYLVFSGPPGTYEICPICDWQDDVSQLRFPAIGGSANELSLVEAQKKFALLSALVEGEQRAALASMAKRGRDLEWRQLEAGDIVNGEGRDRTSEGLRYPADSTQLYYWRSSSWWRSRKTER
jgi:hypothetical protein